MSSMNDECVTKATDAGNPPSRREFLRGALAVTAAVPFLETAAAWASAEGPKTQLWIGAATTDITPPPPVPLTGFTSLRLAKKIQSPLTASVLVLESREGDRVLDQAILITCDLCGIRPGIEEAFRKHLAGRLTGFPVEKLFLAATHNHSSPELLQDRYDAQDYGEAMQPKDYVPLLFERLAATVAKAWESRAPGAVGWGVGQAVVGHNRRIVYADGHAAMSNDANHPQFRHIEGYEDHGVDILCFYDDAQRLKAVALSVACTAQMSQSEGVASGDFWHDARELLRDRYGKDLCVLGFCAPAGDQCPFLTYRKQGETRMDRLRGLTRTQELGRRVANAVFDVADLIAKDIRTDVPLVHLVRKIALPARIVTDEEYAIAQKVCAGFDAKKVRDKSDTWTRAFYGRVCERYEAQHKGHRLVPMELHVLRLGDVAIATSPFELFIDYGVQIQARSVAEQTFLIQLAATAGSGLSSYVATSRAVAGGAMTANPFTNYSATAASNPVGPEGAQVLVDRTVEAIRELWQPPGK